jgi:hypothetical protein
MTHAALYILTLATLPSAHGIHGTERNWQLGTRRSVARGPRGPHTTPRPAAVVVSDFGAVGDGVADDTLALQRAINAARDGNATLRIHDGQYRITSFLDWGRWNGISVVGDGAGQWGTHGVSIWADGIDGTAHDFTGAAYGTVSGVSFTGSATGAMVLNGRTSDGGYVARVPIPV